jgi:DNA-binding beta-propeller fold protein YncE
MKRSPNACGGEIQSLEIARRMEMARTGRVGFALAASVVAALMAAPVNAQNHAPNPYRTVPGVWAELPNGRAWGATSAVYPAADGNIWVAERCGENTCVGHEDLDTILLFTKEGDLVRSFGAGLLVWPHGIHVDPDGNVWVTDARGEGNRGHQVHKFSPDGELLMSLGRPGVAGAGRDTFNQPSDALVAPDGSIFVADGHGAGDNNRIVKLAADGSYITEWGSTGQADGQFRDPHALAMDSQGRLFVGDRKNNRIQIFTQDGEHLDTWTQFGRPSGLYIDANDILYSADSESTSGGGIPNTGWTRGIRIGSVTDGLVTAFIPDPEWSVDVTGTTAAEGVAADDEGNVYGAEVGPRMLRKHVRR